MTPDARLDVVLVRRGLARSRRHAHDLVDAGRVRVDGRTATKPGRQAADSASIQVDADDSYVSRAGNKLAGALDAFGADGPRVEGRRVLDAGASTGGFTDVLLRAGAAEVVAVDVGHHQLVDELRAHRSVRVYERTNVRTLEPDAIGGHVDAVVADLSFISLTLVLPALARCAPGDEAWFVLLVKPQFEVGRREVGHTGVVRSTESRLRAVEGVVAAAHAEGLGVRGIVRSGLQGTEGNQEYLLWLCRGDDGVASADIAGVI